jgi:hypothetical protein
VLYSDDDDFIYRFRSISKENRHKLKHMWKQYDRIKSQVLGFIFDTLVKVLERLKEIQLKEFSRMADCADVCEVISTCLGYPENAFLKAYYKNIATQNDKALESSLVAPLLWSS